MPVTVESPSRAEQADVRFADRIAPLAMIPSGLRPDIVMLGVPQHLGVERNGGRAGAALAPREIREQLMRLTISYGAEEIAPEFVIADAGDLICEGLTLEQIHERQFEVVSHLLKRARHVIVLGGGHDTAVADGRAMAANCRSLGIINIDAHLDVREMRTGTSDPSLLLAHSGSPFRQLLEHEDVHVPAGCFAEFGIQPFVAAAAHVSYVQQKHHHVFMLDELREQGIANALEEWTGSLADKVDAVYCSIDLDAVASAYAPGVSAPATDGFNVEEVLWCIRHLASLATSRIMDIVEGNPLFDVDKRTMRLAARMIAIYIWQKARMRHATRFVGE